ncbi:hypothetical protein [Nitrosarchaeum sp.]|uniref:hypothetical protein n=1 Tax=Nitrosarchaeum sp. TaxID=2026886 RepID=UPI00247F08E1|nr:hypothetical protein [Nitrosarchaeum sp.]MCV0411583.1 hypothetical protein [Nitrosarchaeum sp.]
MPKFILLFLILFAFSGLLIPVNTIYAKSAQDTLTVHTVWVTGNNSCYHNDVQRMNEFNKEIIVKYLLAYGLDFFYYPPTCMTESQYRSYTSPDYTDLVIVVYNQNIGRDILHARNIGGFFEWSNTSNKNALTIETCECMSSNFNDSVWVLSHELAHFALYYLGYDRDIFEGYVHAVQSRYYSYCPDGDTRDSRCDGLWEKIKGYSRDYTVMKVYPGATSVKPPQAKYVNYVGTQNELVQSLEKKINSQSSSPQQYPVFTSQQKQILTKKIDLASESILKIKEGLNESWNYVMDARKNYHSDIAKFHVDKAFDNYNNLYYQRNNIEKDLNSLVSNYLGLEKSVNSYKTTHYDDYNRKLDQFLSQTNKIGYDMKYISQELDYAKKAEDETRKTVPNSDNKQCFLFWCI